jgi:hypothetical protein
MNRTEWTSERVNILSQLLAEGLSHKVIATKLGGNEDSISKACQALGLSKKKYAPSQEQEAKLKELTDAGGYDVEVVAAATGLAKSLIYYRIRSGKLPEPAHIVKRVKKAWVDKVATAEEKADIIKRYTTKSISTISQELPRFSQGFIRGVLKEAGVLRQSSESQNMTSTWSDGKLAKVEALRADGKSDAVIAAEVGSTADAVRSKLARKRNAPAYLTEDSLADVLLKIFPGSTWIRNKAFPGESFRPDFRCEELKLVVEYNGHLHYTDPNSVGNDALKKTVVQQRGYTHVEVPYWIQLDSEMTSHYFGRGVVGDYSNGFPQGFISAKCRMPAEYCSLGARRFVLELDSLPPSTKAAVLTSLRDKVEDNGVDKTLPLSLHHLV